VLTTATRNVTLHSLTFPEIVRNELPTIGGILETGSKNIVVVVEASWIVQSNWHLNPFEKKQRAAAKGYDVGRNHQVGKLIVEMCRSMNIPVVEHIPLRKCWKGKDRKITHEELIQFCPVNKARTNQEERDAALLAWCFANFPIEMRVSQ
jgi:hypothetical protein